MRLWHKDLVPVLPNAQLLAQWRECCAIARNIAVNGTPNHILVNKVMDYPIEHFWAYTNLVYRELQSRGYFCNFYSFSKWCCQAGSPAGGLDPPIEDIFDGWHDDRYYWQCYSNLEEKYDCGGIKDEEWELICDEACLKV